MGPGKKELDMRKFHVNEVNFEVTYDESQNLLPNSKTVLLSHIGDLGDFTGKPFSSKQYAVYNNSTKTKLLESPVL